VHGTSSRLPPVDSGGLVVLRFTSGGGGGFDGLLGLISSTFSVGTSNCNATAPNYTGHRNQEAASIRDRVFLDI
jgi:hypothetical protein